MSCAGGCQQFTSSVQFRHALELELKAALRALAISYEFELRPRDPRPSILDDVARVLEPTHNFAELANLLLVLVTTFRFRLQGDVEAVCNEVNALDPDGQALRYSMIKVGGGATTPARAYVNVPEFVARAGEACTALAILLGADP